MACTVSEALVGCGCVVLSLLATVGIALVAFGAGDSRLRWCERGRGVTAKLAGLGHSALVGNFKHRTLPETLSSWCCLPSPTHIKAEVRSERRSSV